MAQVGTGPCLAKRLRFDPQKITPKVASSEDETWNMFDALQNPPLCIASRLVQPKHVTDRSTQPMKLSEWVDKFRQYIIRYL